MIPPWLDPSTWDWATIWAALQVIGTFAASAAIFSAANQLRFNVWLELQKKWNNPKQRRLRKALFERRERGDAPWTVQEKEDAKDVCGRMDEFARLLKFTKRKEIVEIWYVPVSKLWDVVRPIVREEQQKHPDKWSAFIRF